MYFGNKFCLIGKENHEADVNGRDSLQRRKLNVAEDESIEMSGIC